MGEQFVIGQTLAHRGVRRQVRFGRRRVQGFQRRAPADPATRRQPVRLLPLRQFGGEGQSALRQLADLARGQPLRRRIDGFGQRNLIRLLDRQDVVGVGDLDFAVEALDLARHQTARTAWSQALDMARRTGEPDQVDEAGVVDGADLDRRAVFVRRNQAVNRHLEDADLAVDGLHRRGAPPLDHAAGRQKQHVAHERARHLLHQRRAARPHAFQRGDVGEQGKENLGPHHWTA